MIPRQSRRSQSWSRRRGRGRRWEAGVGTDCPSLPCSTKCLFGRVARRWTVYGDRFQGRRRTEEVEARGSSAQECEWARGQSRWERLVRVPQAGWTLRQSTGEQMEAMRAAAAKTTCAVELAFKGLLSVHNFDDVQHVPSECCTRQ